VRESDIHTDRQTAERVRERDIQTDRQQRQEEREKEFEKKNISLDQNR